jgi:RNA polymerase primary sigma factor
MTEDTSPTRRRPQAVRLLSAAEERALAQRIECGDASAKQTMIESNRRLVLAVAKNYHCSSMPFADLVQEGMIGLIHAADRFDYRREVRFATYALWWVRRAMLDAIAGAAVIRIPPKASRQLAAVRRAEAELARTGLRQASDAEIAERTGLGLASVCSVRTAARVVVSLDQPVGENRLPLAELVADDQAVAPLEQAIAGEDRQQLSAMLRRLPRRHREVLIRRYGLNEREIQSHAEIGEWLGVGEERSRQLEREALNILRSISARLGCVAA